MKWYEQKPQAIVLSEKDCKRFLEIINDNAPPSEALIKAVQRYKLRYKNVVPRESDRDPEPEH